MNASVVNANNCKNSNSTHSYLERHRQVHYVSVLVVTMVFLLAMVVCILYATKTKSRKKHIRLSQSRYWRNEHPKESDRAENNRALSDDPIVKPSILPKQSNVSHSLNHLFLQDISIINKPEKKIAVGEQTRQDSNTEKLRAKRCTIFLENSESTPKNKSCAGKLEKVKEGSTNSREKRRSIKKKQNFPTTIDKEDNTQQTAF